MIQCTYFEYYIQCKDEDANKISVISTAAIYNICQLLVMLPTRHDSLFVQVCSDMPTPDSREMAKGEEAVTQQNKIHLNWCCVAGHVLCCKFYLSLK